MEEAKSYKWPYRARTWSFSLCCVLTVLLGGYIAANNRAWGWNIEHISAVLVFAGAIIIYALKTLIWRCPSCGYLFEMGGSRTRIRTSSLDRCPKCHASFT
jgi:hypothetical protein